MEKLGEFLLLILNILINVFLIGVVLLLLLWIIWGITPKQSLQKSIMWIEDATGRSASQQPQQLSEKYQQRAHRYLYVQEPDKKDESETERVLQPYRYE
ncbi:MAG: hypothetical protein ACI4OR_02690 [Alphaproteobacteria bacterium]